MMTTDDDLQSNSSKGKLIQEGQDASLLNGTSRMRALVYEKLRGLMINSANCRERELSCVFIDCKTLAKTNMLVELGKTR